MAVADGVTTLGSLHESTGLPKSTLVRLLAVLEDENYVLRIDERPAFKLGHGLLAIAARTLMDANVSEVVRPTLRSLAEQTGWTVNFGVLEGPNVVHLCVAFPDRALRFMSSEGDAVPAYASGLGKALLAELAEEDLPRHLPDEPFPSFTENTLTTMRTLRSDLERVRDRGFALDVEESVVGLRCVAVPARDGDLVLGSLSVSGAAAEFDPDTDQDVAGRLYESADALVRQTGLRSMLGTAIPALEPDRA